MCVCVCSSANVYSQCEPNVLVLEAKAELGMRITFSTRLIFYPEPLRPREEELSYIGEVPVMHILEAFRSKAGLS